MKERMQRILIAGIGNIFLGDDAFGVEVAHRLNGRLPETVRVADFGIRGFDLAYALMDEYEAVILVDAFSRGEKPGTLYTIEPMLDEVHPSADFFDAHTLHPAKVLALVKAMGGAVVGRMLIVGCEPASLGTEDDEDGRIGLSPVVVAAVDEAIKLIESLVSKLLAEHPAGQGKPKFVPLQAGRSTGGPP
jgi:hydrogenase maturation protease